MPCWTGNRIGFNSKKLDVFLQKHTFFSFLTNNKTTVNANFASTTGKLYALNFQTLSCPKWGKLKNTWSYFCLLIQALTNESKKVSVVNLCSSFLGQITMGNTFASTNWVAEPDQLQVFGWKSKTVGISKSAWTFLVCQNKMMKTPKTEWKSIRPCVGSRV